VFPKRRQDGKSEWHRSSTAQKIFAPQIKFEIPGVAPLIEKDPESMKKDGVFIKSVSGLLLRSDTESMPLLIEQIRSDQPDVALS